MKISRKYNKHHEKFRPLLIDCIHRLIFSFLRILAIILILFLNPHLSNGQPDENINGPRSYAWHQEDDSLIWQRATAFCTYFYKVDTQAMKQFLPEDFLLQWMHENFITKAGIISGMQDPGTRSTLAFRIKKATVR